MCSERDSPLKRLYQQTHTKLARLTGSGQLVWATGCKLSLALVHARRPAWPGETSETRLRVAPLCKTRPPDHTWVNWPVDASASGSAQVGPGRWAPQVSHTSSVKPGAGKTKGSRGLSLSLHISAATNCKLSDSQIQIWRSSMIRPMMDFFLCKASTDIQSAADQFMDDIR